jgi:hypothetical protein
MVPQRVPLNKENFCAFWRSVAHVAATFCRMSATPPAIAGLQSQGVAEAWFYGTVAQMVAAEASEIGNRGNLRLLLSGLRSRSA